jgi:hypothetical protein
MHPYVMYPYVTDPLNGDGPPKQTGLVTYTEN